MNEAVNKENYSLNKLIYVERYSNYHKLLRVTAFVLRFVSNCRTKANRNLEKLSVGEIARAENMRINDMQSTISKNKMSELKCQLGSYKDEVGIINCKGRLGNSKLPFDSKYPILLPQEYYVTKVVALQCNENVFHAGTNETLAELRSKYRVTKV